ncbi:MAG: hypothetical protein WC160_03335 [Bacilli bacterium]|jgi:hypothetical protein|nr:hypothetical protein [Erysipelotrichaceae bacterium]HQC32300.1 hypothetical protein [Bacilli bacterium]
MTNKKKGLFLTLVAASAFVLSSCNEVTALPKFYEDPIILNDDGTKTDVYQNIMSLIYDALTSSSDNPKKVLDEMMYVIAVDQFGSFAEVEELAAKDANAAEVRTFIEAHDNVYRDENDAEADKVANEFARLVHFKDTMDYRIKEVFHDAATGGSYSKRSRFDEEKYAVSLVGDLYDIEGVFEDATVWYKDVLVTPDVEVEDIVNFVHIDRYQDYIERGVLPRLYREKLVEQFIYDNNYSSLGRTYAREVEYIKIVNNDAYPSAAKSLINAFVDKYILDVNAADEVDFEVLANAWRGIDLSPDAVTLLETAFTGTSVPVTDADVLAQLAGPSVYYPQTQFGSIAKDYLKITDDRFTNDTGIESDFTNSNAYTKQVGLTIKSDSLKLEDYTNDGWYVKSGGLSELPEAIRSRLFNINVANEVGSIEAEDATHSYESGQYVRNLRGEFYLTPTTSEQGTDVRKDNFVIYDISSSTYYIIKVKEAVSTSKLSRLSDNSYPTLEREDIAKEVTHVLSAKDSYINNAYESYIKLYSVIYHDTTIYDYFKEQFPDLFDDED